MRNFFNTSSLSTKREYGFSLLEVMVAIAIIAIALTAVLGSQSQSISLASDARFNTTAPLLAKGKMAEIEAMNLEDLKSDSGDFGEAFSDYTWDLKVNEMNSVGTKNNLNSIKQIDLTISWGDDQRYQYVLRLYRFM